MRIEQYRCPRGVLAYMECQWVGTHCDMFGATPLSKTRPTRKSRRYLCPFDSWLTRNKDLEKRAHLRDPGKSKAKKPLYSLSGDFVCLHRTSNQCQLLSTDPRHTPAFPPPAHPTGPGPHWRPVCYYYLYQYQS